MDLMILTRSNSTIIGPIAYVLGLLMNGIYSVFASIGIENIGLCIIVFTIIINILMLPLTIKQQKFSKLQAKMNPELSALRKKYEGKKDNASVMAQNEEMQAIYAKYGVSQMGSCLPLLVQLPILWALYQVIQNVPAYVASVRSVFEGLAKELIDITSSLEFMKELFGKSRYASGLSKEGIEWVSTNEKAVNAYIDVLNHASTGDWAAIREKFSSLVKSVDIAQVENSVASLNDFLGLNIANSPSFMFHTGLAGGNIALCAAALSIPVLAALSQWINTKLMPQMQPASADANDQASQMANSMRSMNVVMPIFSAFICFSLPIGIGMYWVAGAVVRGILMVIINKHIDNMDIDAMIEKNKEKYKKKLEKMGERTANMSRYASINTRNTNASGFKSALSQEEKDTAVDNARKAYETGKARPGSLLKAANSVKAFEEKNSDG